MSAPTEPDKEVLVYALLDPQSDPTFILKDVTDTLNAKKDPVKLKVSIITSRTKVRGLQVRGIKSETKIKFLLSYREHKMEQALGVQWCISSDMFQFGIGVKENLFTGRGGAVYCSLGL